MIQIQPEAPLRNSIEEKAEAFAKKHSIYESGQDDTAYGYIAGYKQALADLKAVEEKYSSIHPDGKDMYYRYDEK